MQKGITLNNHPQNVSCVLRSDWPNRRNHRRRCRSRLRPSNNFMLYRWTEDEKCSKFSVSVTSFQPQQPTKAWKVCSILRFWVSNVLSRFVPGSIPWLGEEEEEVSWKLGHRFIVHFLEYSFLVFGSFLFCSRNRLSVRLHSLCSLFFNDNFVRRHKYLGRELTRLKVFEGGIKQTVPKWLWQHPKGVSASKCHITTTTRIP